MTTATTRHPLVGLAVFVAAVAVTAVVGSLSAVSASERYQALAQPPWAPPSWLFGPVWTVLYVLIAVSGWLVWKAEGTTTRLLPYAVQLLLNALWTPLFFAAERYTLALVDIIALAIAIIWTITAFRRHRPSALLLVPYLAWVLFATALNAAIVTLN
ncbi:TspO/MBR family protein [Actinosynnema sp. NPDC020468]|uniref:TspO/MBR family protein n=1 Tax=Actinosynnema sp. NPDC020468 TaxID=3154488 RepID=UPI0033EEB3C4